MTMIGSGVTSILRMSDIDGAFLLFSCPFVLFDACVLQ